MMECCSPIVLPTPPVLHPGRELLDRTYPVHNGIQHVLGKWEDKKYLNPKKFNSFANQLKKAGYATAVAGKWNLSWLARNNTVNALRVRRVLPLANV